MDKSSEYNLYRDIKTRTGGEIYLGVVGPVRTGKSTFIKRFMDLCVLPGIEDEHARTRARDELPQSAAGRTIMTTEPKFIPKEAASVRISGDVEVRVRMIDCVGFMVIFGKDERQRFEADRDSYSVEIQRLYDEARTYHDGKWLMFEPKDTSMFVDFMRLLGIKRRPNRK